MEARDLRIGNLVTWIDQEKINDAILTITGLHLSGEVWVDWEWEDGANDGTDCGFDSIKPIPLSEEWLFKFGFGKVIGWFITTSPNITLEVSENNDNDSGQWYCYIRNINAIGEPDDFCLLRKDLRFVHELQNLIHALTGQELTLNQCTCDTPIIRTGYCANCQKDIEIT